MERRLTVRETYDIVKNRAELLLQNTDESIRLAGHELTDKVLPLLENTEDGSMTTTFDKDEMKILLMAMRALHDDARSDEPHIAHTPEFSTLLTKVYKAAPGDEGRIY